MWAEFLNMLRAAVLFILDVPALAVAADAAPEALTLREDAALVVLGMLMGLFCYRRFRPLRARDWNALEAVHAFCGHINDKGAQVVLGAGKGIPFAALNDFQRAHSLRDQRPGWPKATRWLLPSLNRRGRRFLAKVRNSALKATEKDSRLEAQVQKAESAERRQEALGELLERKRRRDRNIRKRARQGR